jgi:hypothetical protein
MKTKIVLLGLLMASVVAASPQAAPSQPGATDRATTGEYSQWAQAPTQNTRHPTCKCVQAGLTYCTTVEHCPKCAGDCPH